MEERTLIVTSENGEKIKLNVIDIIYIEELKKEYIVYTVGENDSVFASILNESEDSFEISTIKNNDEWEIVQGIIDELSTNTEGE